MLCGSMGRDVSVVSRRPRVWRRVQRPIGGQQAVQAGGIWLRRADVSARRQALRVALAAVVASDPAEAHARLRYVVGTQLSWLESIARGARSRPRKRVRLAVHFSSAGGDEADAASPLRSAGCGVRLRDRCLRDGAHRQVRAVFQSGSRRLEPGLGRRLLVQPSLRPCHRRLDTQGLPVVPPGSDRRLPRPRPHGHGVVARLCRSRGGPLPARAHHLRGGQLPRAIPFRRGHLPPVGVGPLSLHARDASGRPGADRGVGRCRAVATRDRGGVARGHTGPVARRSGAAGSRWARRAPETPSPLTPPNRLYPARRCPPWLPRLRPRARGRRTGRSVSYLRPCTLYAQVTLQ